MLSVTDITILSYMVLMFVPIDYRLGSQTHLQNLALQLQSHFTKCYLVFFPDYLLAYSSCHCIPKNSCEGCLFIWKGNEYSHWKSIAWVAESFLWVFPSLTFWLPISWLYLGFVFSQFSWKIFVSLNRTGTFCDEFWVLMTKTKSIPS